MRSVLLALGVALPLAACSLALDTSLDGLKCQDQQCQKDFTCRYDQCIKNESVPEGETCSLSVQCKSGLVCPPGIFTCQKRCTKIYDFNSECTADQVCAPVHDVDPNARGRFVGGACVDVDCSGDPTASDDQCVKQGGKFVSPGAGNKCIRLAKNGGLCLLSCNIGIRSAESKNGNDYCLSDSRGNPTHCGIVPSLDQVCVPAGGAKEGEDCTVFPLSGQQPTSDACGLNVNNGIPGLPLVCSSPKGTASSADGKVRCRIAKCTSNASDCPSGQVCAVTNQNVVVCKQPTEG